MSAPRTRARYLLILTAFLIVADALMLVAQGGIVGLSLFGASLAIHAGLGVGLSLRLRGRLRSSGRHAIWPAAAALYGAAALGAVLFGSGLGITVVGVALNGIALGLSVNGGVAEHRRSGERIHFVVRPAQPV